jgi:hypothetical protein
MLMEVLRIYSSRSSQTPSQLIFVGVRDRNKETLILKN